MVRTRVPWLWRLIPLVVGFLVPTLMVFLVEVGHRGRSPGDVIHDFLKHPSGWFGFFLMGSIGLVPFALLDFLIMRLPETFSRRRIVCVGLFGLLGILPVMVLLYWDALAPFSGKRPSSTSALAFLVVPPVTIVPMLVAIAVGWIISSLSWFRQPEREINRSDLR